MSTIQSLKNFIRHGKQARVAPPPAEPTTNVSTTTIHAEQPRGHGKGLFGHKRQSSRDRAGNNEGAAAAAAAATAATAAQGNGHGEKDESHAQGTSAHQEHAAPAPAPVAATPPTPKTRHKTEIEQIVEEERHRSATMPTYPGLERWELLEKMGDGAFSNVYRARDSTGAIGEVAIKVVRKYEMNPKQRQNILKEVQIMRNLDHPNIVKLYEFSEAPQFYYIILELCPGGELFHQIVRLTYFSEDLSRHVILQVAKAIEYLHEKSGVVHRDIKPENLLFYPIEFIPTKHPKPRQPGDEDKVDEGEFTPGLGGGGIGQVKVADFGLSKVIWDNETMTPCGTVGYTAPEIVKDERYSKSVDMWALGCVLYTLLCGFPPFYDESIQVLTEKVARGQYTFLSPWWDDISKPAQDLVSHLLTVDPEKRYTIHEFLNHPWIRQVDEETTAAADAPPLATPMAGPAGPLLETPLAERIDFRSPGAINLREVFDVGYAVHRQEEEDKMRKKMGYGRGNQGGFRAALNSLNEDSDEENAPVHVYETVAVPQAQQQRFQNELASMEARLRQTEISGEQQRQQQQQQQQTPYACYQQPVSTHPSAAAQARQSAQPPRSTNHQTPRQHRQPQQAQPQQPQQQQQQRGAGYGSHSPAVAAAARESAARRNRQPFELSLDNSTLLEKRRRMHTSDGAEFGHPHAGHGAVPAMVLTQRVDDGGQMQGQGQVQGGQGKRIRGQPVQVQGQG